MDLGCFHKYIAFYAYINCCKTNSSLKRGNEKVAISNINTIISNDIQKVWNIVLAVDKYNSWRSDLLNTQKMDMLLHLPLPLQNHINAGNLIWRIAT